MNKKSKLSMHRMMMLSVVYFLCAFMILSVTVYAWFIITNENNTQLVSYISDVEAEYEFYIYQNKLHDGSNNLTLEDNICDFSHVDLCYKLIPNPTSAHLMDGSAAPGERYSFAIKILALGNSVSFLNLSMNGVTSTGYDLEQNRIQNAFYYEVTKIVYVQNNIETEDKKDNSPTVYSYGYFNQEVNHSYSLVRNLPLFINEELGSSLIIFFDFYFDPSIYGSDINQIPYTNSNIFMNQIFTVEDIFMLISSELI
jgi:hypothetical protein